MKKLFFINLLFLFSIATAQIKFEKGYLITNDGEKHEVLIKNEDWLINPTEFIYKTLENSPEQIGTIKNVKEFQVYGYDKLIRYEGKIESSPRDINQLSEKEEPIWKDKMVFLYLISSGKKELYSYKNNENYSFFYSEEDKNIKPLIFKIYNPDGDQSKIAKNKTYISQLEKIFNDNPKALNLLNNIEYNKVKLAKIFDLYNGTTKIKKSEKNKINLSIRPGLTFNNNLNVVNDNILNTTFPTKTSFRVGIELEYVFPFNKNKWAIILEPTYFNYSNKSQTLNPNSYYNSSNFNSTINYSRIELPIGIRHYMFINNNSKIFINGLVNFKSFIQKPADFTYTLGSTTNENLDINDNGVFLNFGAGYNYKNKYTTEIRFAPKKNILKYYSWSGDFSYLSLVFGYNIF